MNKKWMKTFIRLAEKFAKVNQVQSPSKGTMKNTKKILIKERNQQHERPAHPHGIFLRFGSEDGRLYFWKQKRRESKRYRENGGRYVTIGSDAHVVEDIGADDRSAKRLIEDVGLQEVVYRQRKLKFN